MKKTGKYEENKWKEKGGIGKIRKRVKQKGWTYQQSCKQSRESRWQVKKKIEAQEQRREEKSREEKSREEKRGKDKIR